MEMDITLIDEHAGRRLDRVLVDMFPQYSRRCLQNWLKNGDITLNGQRVRPKQKVCGGEKLEVRIPATTESIHVLPQAIDLDIVYDDPELIIINKSAGMVVHPAAGNKDGTLQNALLYHYPELANLPRSGIVHRLDKDTSGLLVVARSLEAHKSLIEQLRKRTVIREYTVIVQGRLIVGSSIDEPIGRHPQDRKRMCVRTGGRKAVTHYRIIERYRQHTQLLVKLETGRTHQIRVHMAYIKKPVVGDPVYAGRLHIPAQCGEPLRRELRGFKRQALHAIRLGLVHPKSGESLSWHSPLADDIQRLIDVLKNDTSADERNG